MQLKRIFIDITQTYHNDINTGIQRVARNIVEQMQEIAAETDIESYPVLAYRNSYYIIDFNVGKKYFTHRLSVFLKRHYGRIKSFVNKYPWLNFILKKLFPCFVRAKLIVYYNKFINIVNYFTGKFSQLKFSEGDVLLLVEAGWVNPNYKAVKKARRNGARIVQIIHDLIPIKYPQFVHSASRNLFDSWIRETTKYADAYICNSKYTCNELKKNIEGAESVKITRQNFSYFTLGYNLDCVNSSDPVRADLENIFDDNSNKVGYLCVGTIEPRKNQMYLLDAFERIWARNPDAKLFIAGRIGWKGEKIADRVKKHVMLNKSLYMFNDLSDKELDFLYRKCKALIFPTIIEGFGLPIVEALSHKLPVLASNIDVLRETGKDYVSYFDLEHSESLSKIIIGIEDRNKWPNVRNINEFKITTWRESCEQLLEKMEQCL